MLQHLPKVLVVAGAVPAAVAELELALADPQPRAPGNLTHDLGLRLAQLSLLARQPLGLPADAVGVHDQRAAHRPGGGETFNTIQDSSFLLGSLQ